MSILAVLLVLTTVTGASSSPVPSGSARLSAGHDTELLADPEGEGVLRSVDAPFVQIDGEGRLIWRRIGGGSNRLSASASGLAATYGGDGPSLDLGAWGSGIYSRTTGETSAFQLRSRAGFFRRDEIPLFDLDERSIGASWLGTLGSWWIVGSIDHDWISHGGRPLVQTPTEHESQRRVDLALSATYRFSAGNSLGSEAAYRHVESNESTIDHEGPSLRCTYDGSISGNDRLRLHALWTRRLYRSYPVLELDSDPVVDTGRERDDRAVRVGIEWEHSLSSHLRLEVGGTFVKQTSNIGAFEFDQSRMTVEISLRSPDRPSRSFVGLAHPGPIGPTQPEAVTNGVRFRCRAPDADRVVLVGGFNLWDVNAHPLQDPDGDGTWEVVVPIPGGTWQYAFVVDGTWTQPADAVRYADDGFGGTNGVLDVATEPDGEGGP